MSQRILSFGSLLRILLTNTNSTSAYFANHYVYKDPSLISKWLHDTQFPTPDTFPNIVQFAMEQSSMSTKKLMRIEINRVIENSSLDDETKRTLGEITEFDNYLIDVLNALANMKNREKQSESRDVPHDIGRAGEIELNSVGGRATSDALPDATAEAPADIHTVAPPMVPKDIALAGSAAISGELLMLIIAFLFKLSMLPGFASIDNGILGCVWGLLLALPVISFALMSLRREKDFVCKLSAMKIILYIVCYSAAGGLGGLLLGLSGFSEALSGQFLGRLATVLVSSLVLSFLPLLALLSLLGSPRLKPGTFILLEAGPALLCVVIELPFLLLAPGSRLGTVTASFVVGFLMYVSVISVLKSHPGVVRFRLFF